MLEMAVQPADRAVDHDGLVHRARHEAAAPAAKQPQLPVGIEPAVTDPPAPEHVAPRHRVSVVRRHRRPPASSRSPRAARPTRPRRRRATGSTPRAPARSRSSSGRRSPATAARTRDRSARARWWPSCRATRRPPRSARRPTPPTPGTRECAPPRRASPRRRRAGVGSPEPLQHERQHGLGRQRGHASIARW